VWQDAIIINETAAKALGYNNAADIVDQTILWSENERPIPKKVIGVVKDFNQQSLRSKIEPFVFTLKEYIFARGPVNFTRSKSRVKIYRNLYRRFSISGQPCIHKIHLTISSSISTIMRNTKMMTALGRYSLSFQVLLYSSLHSDSLDLQRI
jgi:hypothetical protein